MRSIATTVLFAGFLAFTPASYGTLAAVSPKCAGMSKGACWLELTNRPGCYIHFERYESPMTATWSGACAGGIAVGPGTVEWGPTSSGESTGTLDSDGNS